MTKGSSDSIETVDGPWGRTLLVAGALTLAAVCCFMTWHPDTLCIDTDEAWLAERQLASDAGRLGVIFLGSSRVQAGIRLPQVKKQWPECAPIQLGLVGNSSLLFLEDLADDPAITGTVVYELFPNFDFRQDTNPETPPSRLVSAHHRTLAWTKLREALHLYSSFSNAYSINWNDLFKGMCEGRSEADALWYRYSDRRELYLDLTHPACLAANTRKAPSPRALEAPAGPEDRSRDEKIRQRFQRAVAKIEQRGGLVIFVYFPEGRVGELRAGASPLWIELLSSSGARGYHYLDHPSLAAYRCPDGGHLDQVDAPRFTAALMALIDKDLSSERGSLLRGTGR